MKGNFSKIGFYAVLISMLYGRAPAPAEGNPTSDERTATGEFKPSATAIYSRSAAGSKSADYSSVLAGRFGIFYGLADQSSVALSTGFSRDQDAPEERNVWSSTSMIYSSRAFEVFPDYQLTYGGSLVAPTNPDSRRYLSYRGSLGLNASLGRELRGVAWIPGLLLALTGGANRNFFQYDSSIAGNPNTTYSFSGGIAAVARFNEFFQLDSGFLLERSRKSNGSL
ncbi:MAG TPA: hypothetical protein VE954_23645, partial [Oligoflexus sp.]|uniref:hypothetical protein n=1 Tax=Oligoflexus sp. TaxID=1971216 RepID=UPI002D72C545